MTPPLQLEIGKRYRRHDGQITGPLEKTPNNLGYPFFDPVTLWSYTEDGVFDRLVPHPGRDLVSEYIEPPSTQLQAGKRYVMRSGVVTPPLSRVPETDAADPFYDGAGNHWDPRGRVNADGSPDPADIVSEYVEPALANTSLGQILDEKSDAALFARLDAFKSTAWEALDRVAPRHRWANVFVSFKTPQNASVPDLLRLISEAIRKQDIEPSRRDFADEFLRRVDGLSKQVDNIHEELDTFRR